MTQRNRRARGTGAVYFNARQDRWVARIKAVSGRELFMTFKTRKEAEERLRQLIEEHGGIIADVNAKPLPRSRGRKRLALPPPRREVPPGLRFQILERDGFACRYCGARPSRAELRVDHVHPVSLGGSNDPGNLVTACQECNSGKGRDPITDEARPVIPPLEPVEIDLEFDLRIRPGPPGAEKALALLEKRHSGKLALDVLEVALLLRKDALDVLVCAQLGLIPVLKLGTAWTFPVHRLREWLRESKEE